VHDGIDAFQPSRIEKPAVRFPEYCGTVCGSAADRQYGVPGSLQQLHKSSAYKS